MCAPLQNKKPRNYFNGFRMLSSKEVKENNKELTKMNEISMNTMNMNFNSIFA